MTYLVECKTSTIDSKTETTTFAEAYRLLQEFVSTGQGGWCTITNEKGEEECTCVINMMR